MEPIFVCSNLFFVRPLGANAIAVSGATITVTILCYSVAIGIASSAVVSRRIGKNNFKAAGHSAMQTIYIAIPLALVISCSCFIWEADIMSIIGLSPTMITKGGIICLLLALFLLFVL